MASLLIEPSGQSCGANVTGVDLAAPLDAETVAAIRAAWLQHLVLAFPDQRMDDDALERFAIAMGGFYRDPFFAPVPGRTHIVAIKREAGETASIFAEGWHSDWSFEERPPAGTCLYAIDVPPTGGDTVFANQYAAWDELPADRKERIADLTALHSARRAFAPDAGYYAKTVKGRSMAITPGEHAMAVRRHPLVQRHPETGRNAIFSTWGYIVGIEDMRANAADHLLITLQRWQVQDRFLYTHRWEPGTLVLWDNRAVLHRATGGYEGHRRLLHRITVAPPADLD